VLAHPQGMGICPSVLDNYDINDIVYWYARLSEVNRAMKKARDKKQ
jgi:hypothetical protein